MFEAATAPARRPAATQPTTADAGTTGRAEQRPAPDSAGATTMPAESVPSAFQTAVRMAADEAREAAFGPAAQAQARDWAASMASGSVSRTSEAARRELGPAIAAVLRWEASALASGTRILQARQCVRNPLGKPDSIC